MFHGNKYRDVFVAHMCMLQTKLINKQTHYLTHNEHNMNTFKMGYN